MQVFSTPKNPPEDSRDPPAKQKPRSLLRPTPKMVPKKAKARTPTSPPASSSSQSPQEAIIRKSPAKLGSKKIVPKGQSTVPQSKGGENSGLRFRDGKNDLYNNSLKRKFAAKLALAKLKLLGKEEVRKGRRGEVTEEKHLTRNTLLGIAIVFLFYNLVFLAMTETASWTSILGWTTIAFGAPSSAHELSIVFGSALTLFFLISAILVNINKIRYALIAKKWTPAVFFAALFAGMYGLAYGFQTQGWDTLPFLLVLSSVWLVVQSINFYTLSRGFSTKIETRLVEKYSKTRLAGAFILPLVIVGILVFVSWGYRYWWITFALDVVGSSNALAAVDFYTLLTTVVIPALYFIVILITLFLILVFALSFKRAETRTAGIWDNLTFALMCLFLFFWMLFMVTLFLLLNPTTQIFSSSSSSSGSAFFFVEFGISMIFLVLLVRQIGASVGWKFLFLRRDGLIFFLLATIMGQSVSRFAISGNSPGGVIQNYLTSDRLIIPMMLIVILGLTVLIYYLRPQKMSMFMRREQEIIQEQDRAKDLILKFLRREFIRKGKKFRIDSIDQRIVEVINVPINVVHSLIRAITDEYVDIILEEEVIDGVKVKYIDFVPITERYQDSAEADERARHHLTEQLAGSLKVKNGGERQRILVKTKKKASKQKGAVARSFISTLQSSFFRKAQEEKQQKLKTVDFKRDLQEDVVEILVQFLRSEYITRIKDTKNVSDPAMSLLDIAARVEEVTKVNPAELASTLDTIAHQEPDIVIYSNPEDPNDKIIDYNPIFDAEVSDLFEKFRVEKLAQLRIYLWQELSKSLGTVRNKILSPIKRHEANYNISIDQLLNNLQRMWRDPNHPRLKTQETSRLAAIIDQLTPKKTTDI